MERIVFAATGDSLINRRLADYSPQVDRVARLTERCDVVFTNLETVIRRNEGFPAAQSGGTWTSSPPGVLADLKTYCINLVSWATNHTLDYSYGGLAATQRYLEESGLVHAGAGANLAEASLPKYLDTPAGRVALIAVTASFHESWIAGEQRSDMVGRPGINPLRHETYYRIAPERLKELRELAQVSGINATRELMVRNGFATPDKADLVRFGNHLFRAATPGENEGAVTTPHQGDMQRILKSIDEARRQAAYTVVSFHAHQFKDGRNEVAADFVHDFAHACIDQGAHAVIGHGPHIVRGIELYRGRPIFYSLGNFIFQSDTVTNLPSDYYTKYGLGPEHTTADALDVRSDCDSRGYAVNPAIWRSILPLWRMEEGELKSLVIYPLALGFVLPRHARGWPVLTDDLKLLEEVMELSRPYGLEFEMESDRIVWQLPGE